MRGADYSASKAWFVTGEVSVLLCLALMVLQFDRRLITALLFHSKILPYLCKFRMYPRIKRMSTDANRIRLLPATL